MYLPNPLQHLSTVIMFFRADIIQNAICLFTDNMGVSN
jgi:hypothetical protein